MLHDSPVLSKQGQVGLQGSGNLADPKNLMAATIVDDS